MKIVVINAFIDKNTSEPYNTGSIFESTDKERIAELQDSGFLAAVEKTDKKDKQAEKQDDGQDK